MSQPDDSELRDIDPYAALDAEAARIERHFATLSAAEVARPSRCKGWSVRDVLAHLLASEGYHQACLDGRVKEFLSEGVAKGGHDLDSLNELGVREHDGESVADMLAAWKASNADTRQRFRERGDGVVDTSVGEYPARWQAVHVAAELATHADDAYAPVETEEAEGRRAWRVRYSRFALAEVKPDVSIIVDPTSGRTSVARGDVQVAVDDETLVEAVMDRLPAGARLSADQRALLAILP